MAVDTTKNTGTFGEAPAHAPRETAQPLQPGTLASQIAQAQANERTLAPFNPPQALPIPNVAESTLAAAARERAAEKRAETQVEGEPHQPAASDTDSPRRGVPMPIADVNKRVTGGWGGADEAQYTPLNGLEVAEVLRMLMGELSERLERDLMFSLAITYPRARITLTARVEGYATTQPVDITMGKIHDKTPEDVAARLADPVNEVRTAERTEFDDEGTPQDPPDRMRDEVGLEKPRKQWVGEGAGRQMVDINEKELF